MRLSKWKFTSASLYKYPHAAFFSISVSQLIPPFTAFWVCYLVQLDVDSSELFVCPLKPFILLWSTKSVGEHGKLLAYWKCFPAIFVFLPLSWDERRSNAAPRAAQTKLQGMLLCFSKLPPTFLQLVQQGFARSLTYTDLWIWNMADKYLLVVMKYGYLADIYMA